MVSSRSPFFSLTLCLMGIRLSRVTWALLANGLRPGSVSAERSNGRLTESDLRRALVAAYTS